MVAHCVQLKIHPVKINIYSIDLKNKGMYRLLFFQVIKNTIYKEAKMGFSDVLTNGLHGALNVIS